MPTQDEDYIPFGEEWEKAMMKMSKATIVKMYRKVCIEKLQLEEKMKEAKNAEIERLKSDIADLRDDNRYTTKLLDERNAEIADLRAQIQVHT